MLVHSYYLRDVRVRREAEELARVGAEVHVVCLRTPAGPLGFREPKREKVNGVNIHRVNLSRRRGGTLRYLFEFAAMLILGTLRLTALHAKKAFDIVHIHNMPDILVFAGIFAKWTGAELILDVHDPMSELYGVRRQGRRVNVLANALVAQERISYKFADHILTVNQPMAKVIAKKMQIDTDSIRVIHNFPDPATFPIREGTPRWPRNTSRFVVLYSGTVTEHYRVDIAVRAIAIASRTIPGIELHILGEGDRLTQVLDLAAELGVANRVTHFPAVGVEMVKAAMATADVGISTHGGSAYGDLCLSNKLLEYLTQGLPVVCSRTTTTATYLPDEAICFFEPGNVHECANNLIAIWSDPVMVRRKLEQGARLAERLNWDSERLKLTSLYEEVFKSRASFGIRRYA